MDTSIKRLDSMIWSVQNLSLSQKHVNPLVMRSLGFHSDVILYKALWRQLRSFKLSLNMKMGVPKGQFTTGEEQGRKCMSQKRKIDIFEI